MASGTSEEDLDFASVQRDNPEMERRCQEVIDRCAARGDANPILAIHDVGAGGLSNALPELVDGYVYTKIAAARANTEVGKMDQAVRRAIEAGGKAILAGKYRDQLSTKCSGAREHQCQLLVARWR